jgi:NADPH2:quinone reductase
MTAHYLVKSTFVIKKGDWVLIHASAGGMGLILVALCKHLGAHVIGTCSTEEKAEISRKAGVDHVILYSKTNFAEEVKKITSGRGVDVIYDGVGKDTFLNGISLYIVHCFSLLAHS